MDTLNSLEVVVLNDISPKSFRPYEYSWPSIRIIPRIGETVDFVPNPKNPTSIIKGKVTNINYKATSTSLRIEITIK